MSKIDDYVSRFIAAFDINQRKMMHRFKEKLDQMGLGLTGPQFFMLHLVSELEPCKSTALAEKMDVKPSAITVMIDRLVQSGFVSRHPDEHDRRVVLVRLTESGRNVLEKLSGMRREMLRQSFANLTQEETDTFVTLFEKMVSPNNNNKKEEE
jgi:DNA-binding MarR family transcriptional regulator